MVSVVPATLNNPYAIFAAARQHWEAERFPAELSYTVVITVTRNGDSSHAHYHSFYDSFNNRVNVVAVSDEELAQPYTPHGINFSLSPFGGRIPLSSPDQTFDYLGVPVLAPNYSFGIATQLFHAAGENSDELVREIRQEFNDPAPSRTRSDVGLKTIASIDVVRRSYIITLKGIVTLNRHSDYDLVLRPLADPARYRLREMWVNAETLATEQLRSDGNFVQGGMTSVPWTVSFVEDHGATYIRSESTDVPFTLERRHYDAAAISFDDLHSATIPAFMQISTFISNEHTGVPPLTEL